MEVLEVLDTIIFNTCKVRREIVDGMGTPTEWVAAYSLVDGSYIGNAKDAEMWEKMGVMPEAIPGNKVASIGWCEREQKWYGWSHRSYYGFGIGAKISRGDNGYMPIDPQDLLDSVIRFWVDSDSEYTTADVVLRSEIDVPDPNNDFAGLGALVEIECVRKKDDEVIRSIHWRPYPDTWGPGEWKAKTLTDAKQMAMDFAKSVS